MASGTGSKRLRKTPPGAGTAVAALTAPRRPRLPLHVLLDEAVQAASFVERRWTTRRAVEGQVVMPGLDLVARADFVSARTRDEILELVQAIRDADRRFRLSKPGSAAAPLGRCRAVIRELRGVLRYAAQGRPELLAQVREVTATASPSNARSAVAMELDTWASLARRWLGEIEGLGGFAAERIDEAVALASELRDRPRVDPERELALVERNRIASELMAKIAAVRAAAKLVFRARPEIIREVTSAYERQTRVARLRRHRKGERGVSKSK